MENTVNPVAKMLFQLMLEKRLNLVVAVYCDKAGPGSAQDRGEVGRARRGGQGQD